MADSKKKATTATPRKKATPAAATTRAKATDAKGATAKGATAKGQATKGAATKARVEAELRDALQRLDHHMRNTPLGVLEWDAEGRLTRWSQGAERIFGWKADEVLGKRAIDIRMVHPDDVEMVMASNVGLADGSTPRTVTSNRNVRSDGDIVTVEWRNSALYDEAGRLSSVLSLVLDVTEQRQFEEALRTREAQLQGLADAMPQIVWTADAEGQVSYANARWFEYTGMANGPLTVDEMRQAIHPDDRRRTSPEWRAAIQRGQAYEQELRLRRRDGEWRWHLVRAVPLPGAEGRATSWCGTSTDIHDRHAIEQKTRFLASLGDRLRLMSSPVEMMRHAAAALRAHLHADACAFIELDPARGTATSIIEDAPRRLAGMASALPGLGDPASYLFCLLRAEGLVAIGEADRAGLAALDGDDKKALAGPVPGSFVAAPLRVGGRLAAILVVARASAHEWTPQEKNVVERAADRSWAAIEAARTAQSLRESDERYRTVLQVTGQVLWDLDVASGTATWSEEAVERVLGFRGRDTSTEANDWWREALHPDDAERVLGNFSRALKGDAESYSDEYRLRRGDGRLIHILDRGLILRDPATRAATRVIGALQDISPQRQAEADARFLAELSDAIRPLQSPGEITWEASAALCRHLGADRCVYVQVDESQGFVVASRNPRDPSEAMAGTVPFASFPESLQVAREGGTYVVNDVAAAPRVGERELSESYPAHKVAAFISRPIIKDRQLVALMVACSSAPREWKGSEIALVEQVSERTWAAAETARAIQALKAGEERFRLAVKATHDIVYDCDMVARQIHRVVETPEECFGHPPEVVRETLGWWLEIMHPDDRDDVFRRQCAVVDDPAASLWEAEYRLRRADGTYAHVLDRGLVVRDPATGQGLRMIGAMLDVTPNRAAQEKLQDLNAQLSAARDSAEQANLAKSRFLANMSHELRTPLASIMLFCEMMYEDSLAAGNAEQAKDLERVLGAGHHLRALIDDILDLAKIEAGRMTLSPREFELEPLLREAVETSLPLVERNRNKLEARLSPGLGKVFLDPTKLRQSLFNLLSNSSKFTQNGTVTLEAQRRPATRPDEETGEPAEELVLRVSDTGIGIAPDVISRLFQDFEQGDPSLTRKYGGTGLGLSLSRRFVEMMGGSIGVSSNPGKGATFTIRLPTKVPKSVMAQA